MGKYLEPTFEILKIEDEIITTSGTETTHVENTDGVWDLNQNV